MWPSISIGSMELPSFIVLYALAFATAAILAGRGLAAAGFPKRVFPGLLAAAIIFGMIGGKTYFIFSSWDLFVLNPIELLFSASGSGWYGGFTFGMSAILVCLVKMKQPVLKAMDIIAPAAAVGQVLGRLGCFLSGCCYGKPSNLPWAVTFPNTIYPPQVRVHPTQVYEMAVYAAVALFLSRRSGTGVPGSGRRAGTYLVLSCSGRFFIEFLRPNLVIMGHLTAPQLFSIVGILVGIALAARGTRTAVSPAPFAARVRVKTG
jgi:phosphatidylglycerol---prolipoprotein diacylglyceryl transferase